MTLRTKRLIQLSASAGTTVSSDIEADYRYDENPVRGYIAVNTDATTGAVLEVYAKSIVSANDPSNSTNADVTVESLYASYTSASVADVVNGPFDVHYFRTSVGDWNIVWIG